MANNIYISTDTDPCASIIKKCTFIWGDCVCSVVDTSVAPKNELNNNRLVEGVILSEYVLNHSFCFSLKSYINKNLENLTFTGRPNRLCSILIAKKLDAYLTAIFNISVVYYIYTHPDVEAIVHETGKNSQIYKYIDLKRISGLKLLSIPWQRVSANFISRIRYLHSLEYLNICGIESVSSKNIDFLDSLDNLRYLNIADCMNIDDACLLKISELKNLEVLIVAGNVGGNPKITHDGFKKIASLKNLKRLVIINLPITNSTMAEIGKCTDLRELQLVNCPLITNDGLKSLQHLSRLRIFSLDNCHGITEIDVCKYWTFLEKLSLRNVDVSASIKPDFIAGLNNLKQLTLENISGFSDESLKFCTASKSLQSLYLYKNSLITDAGIKYIAKLKNLELLHLRQCPLITDGAIEYLQTNAPAVRVDVNNCIGIKDIGSLTDLLDVLHMIEQEYIYGDVPVYKPQISFK